MHRHRGLRKRERGQATGIAWIAGFVVFAGAGIGPLTWADWAIPGSVA